jgi:hypothetical protein
MRELSKRVDERNDFISLELDARGIRKQNFQRSAQAENLQLRVKKTHIQSTNIEMSARAEENLAGIIPCRGACTFRILHSRLYKRYCENVRGNRKSAVAERCVR